MKVHCRSLSGMLPALVLTLTLTGSLPAQGLPPNGPYGFLLNWSFSDLTNQGGIALLGVMNFDGAGHVSGPYTLELGSGGGQTQSTTVGTFSGTYSSVSVYRGGTGSMTITFDAGFTLTLDMVIVDGGHGLDLVATACPGGGCGLREAVVNGVARHTRKGQSNPALAALHGSYGFQLSHSPQGARDVGVAVFDRWGSVTASDTFVGAGLNVSTGSYAGTYTVNFNETGAITFNPQPGQGAQTFAFVITDGGSELLLLQLNRLGDGVTTGIARIQQ